MMFMIIFALVLVAIAIGHASGNQPKRDAVAAAQDELGIALENRRIDLGDVMLNVVFAGPEDGKPVVLLHGYPEFWYAWRGPMAVLARAGFRVIVPDQRGYNDSDKPSGASAYTLDRLAGDVARLVDVLGYDKVCLAGHDFGGQVSWWTLLLHPEKIERFVIVNKPHPQAHLSHDDDGASISWYRKFLQIPLLPGFVGRIGNWGLLVKNLKATSLPDTFRDETMGQYRSAWANNGAIQSMGAWYRANAGFAKDVNMNISVPGQFILAPEDKFSPKALGALSMPFLKNAELVELEEGTHWVIQERPELIGEMLASSFGDRGMRCAHESSPSIWKENHKPNKTGILNHINHDKI